MSEDSRSSSRTHAGRKPGHTVSLHMAFVAVVAAAVASMTLSFLTPSAEATAIGEDARDGAADAASRSMARIPAAAASAQLLTAQRAARDHHRLPEPGTLPRLPQAMAAVALDLDRDTEEQAMVGEGIQLVLPAAYGADAIVGFHQAGSHSGAQPLLPQGQTLNSAFPSFEPVTRPGEDHVVLAPRGRGTSATSAVDVALPEDEAVLAPVDGVVATVSPYSLYGRIQDVTIAIIAADDPSLVVHMFHLDNPVVAVGERVEAGVTPIAVPRSLPFPSQIDRVTKDARPHVHLEVRPNPN